MIHSVEQRTGHRLRFENMPLDDEQTYALFSQGDTFGVFQLESEGMKRVLRELQPTTFEDIVAVNALFRPGPMEQIPTYISRKHGRERSFTCMMICNRFCNQHMESSCIKNKL